MITAYVLADADYDVWLPNSRGNFYSRHHLTLNPKDANFWNFTWYEMAIFDQPAIIDYILKETNNKKLYYVGHSQGTTTLLTLLSEKPKYNNKIIAASLMSPVGYFYNANALLETAARTALFLLQPLSTFEFLPRVKNGFYDICSVIESIGSPNTCDDILDIAYGLSENQKNEVINSFNNIWFRNFDLSK